MTVDGSQFTPIIVNTLNPLMYRSGMEEKPVQKIGLDYKAPLKKRSAGGASILWGECVRHPPDKKSLLSGFYLHPRSHFLYKLNLYSSLSLSHPSRSYFLVAHTRAPRVGKTLHRDNSQLSCNFHSPRSDKSEQLRYQLFVPSLLRCVPGMFSDEDAHV